MEPKKLVKKSAVLFVCNFFEKEDRCFNLCCQTEICDDLSVCNLQVIDINCRSSKEIPEVLDNCLAEADSLDLNFLDENRQEYVRTYMLLTQKLKSLVLRKDLVKSPQDMIVRYVYGNNSPFIVPKQKILYLEGAAEEFALPQLPKLPQPEVLSVLFIANSGAAYEPFKQLPSIVTETEKLIPVIFNAENRRQILEILKGAAEASFDLAVDKVLVRSAAYSTALFSLDCWEELEILNQFSGLMEQEDEFLTPTPEIMALAKKIVNNPALDEKQLFYMQVTGDIFNINCI